MPPNSTRSVRDRLNRWGSTALGLGLFSWALWVITQEVRQYEAADIWAGFQNISRMTWLLAIALTALNYWILTGYDTLAVKFVGKVLSYPRTAFVGVVSYGISNGVGFRFFSGAAVRLRFYRQWGFSLAQIAQIVTFCSFSFWLGLLSIAGFLFVFEPSDLLAQFNLPFTSTRGVGVLLLAIVSGYLILCGLQRQTIHIGRWQLPQLTIRLSLGQIGLTTLDWATAASVAYALLPPEIELSYGEFVGIYLVAQISGVLSNVPGGLGIFESVLLLLLPSVSSAALLGTLVAYRGIYYGVPLLTGLLLLGGYELYQQRHAD